MIAALTQDLPWRFIDPTPGSLAFHIVPSRQPGLQCKPGCSCRWPDIHLAGKPLRLGRSEFFAKLGVLRTELFRERFAKLLVFFLKL